MSEDARGSTPGAAPTATTPATAEVETIQLLEEALRVSKRTVERGRVRIAMRTDTEDREVRETLQSRRVEVERVAVGRQLAPGETAPQSRTEGDVLIVPLVQETLVIEKRLTVTEELRIRVVLETEDVDRTVPLRRQTATVERLAADGLPPS